MIAQACGFHSQGAVKIVETLQDSHECPVYPFDKRIDAIASLLLSHSRECRDSLKPMAFRLCPGIRETRELREIQETRGDREGKEPHEFSRGL